MIRQRPLRIEAAFKVRTVDCRNAFITDRVYRRFRSFRAPGSQDTEIIPFSMADKDDGCR